MSTLSKDTHALVTLYGGDVTDSVQNSIEKHFPRHNVRTLLPKDKETLLQSARNSALTIIAVKNATDQNVALGKMLQNEKDVVGDIVAYCPSDSDLSGVQIMGKGFDCAITQGDVESSAFCDFLVIRILKGEKNLLGFLQKERYRRIRDALAIAPVSMIIFDANKRTVFVSDHYYRAYPKIASRMIDGLSAFEAFEMMIKEEGVIESDPRHARLRDFWYNLRGSVEFRLDDGANYKLKAVELPAGRGTVVMGQKKH